MAPTTNPDDLLLCARLCEAALHCDDNQLPAMLSAIALEMLGAEEGGFFSSEQEVPAHLPMIAQVLDGPICHGTYAVSATPEIQARLDALTTLTSHLFRQRKESRQQKQILEQIQDSVITLDLAGFITGWNRGAERLFGYTADEAVGQNLLFLYADEDASDSLFHDAFLEHGGREMEVRRRRKNGDEFWASMSLSLVRDEQGQPTGLIGYLRDITDRLEAEQNLRLHSRIFENSDEAIIVTDAKEHIVAVNPSFCRITGFTAQEVLGKTPRLFRSGQHDTVFYENVWAALTSTGRWQGEMWDRRKNGDEFPQWASITAVRNSQGEITHYFSIFSDITERKLQEEQIHHMAYYDDLTGLPNRALLFKLLDQALNESRRSRNIGALLFIDLNRFKPINDTLGHDAGDQLLKEVGQRFCNVLRDTDVVCRHGGDEFVVALMNVARHEEPGIVAQKLISVLDEPFLILGHELQIGASIGISIFPDDAFDAETLLRYADIAMYRAKQSDNDSYVYFSHEMNQKSLDRLKIEAGLKRALDRHELLLYYQPKVALDGGHIVGAEALVRWQHPERGMVPPGEFIPVAEETGLIIAIGDWVMDAACAQARQWLDAGMPTTRIAVNLSARQFAPGLPDRVKAVLEKYQLPPQWLELEITESMLMHSAESVIALMDELTAFGVSLSLDDFGTGYSSLSYLKRFPIETLKIDRSFIMGTPDDANDCAIAGAIVSMAKRLRHRVIAEGVETAEQVEFLRTLGCHEIQGYFFSPPVPAEKFAQFIKEGKSLV
ncbi:MAG TPA: EAL domain-containing protein [Rhodocyclaceae bacterium]|jgi:diguanylate cyclase (GGDEF)-like protein/PAS domain S-box-containing protein